MAKTNSLVDKLAADFPDIHFEVGDDFYWSPSTATVHAAPVESEEDVRMLLHEVAHAQLGHSHFKRDIDLVKIEREAWDYVKNTLAPKYKISAHEDDIEDMLDTYREWLHARSACPHCSMTGIQTDASLYHCLGCGNDWRVNDARRCGLKRYMLSST